MSHRRENPRQMSLQISYNRFMTVTSLQFRFGALNSLT